LNGRNLLIFYSDQHRADVLPSAGNLVIEAPHLGALADESFVFSRAYCAQPVCTPARASLLTGLWPHHHGAATNNAPLPPDVRTLAEYLPDSYATAHVGKWHLGDELNPQHGFREWRSIEDGYAAHYSIPEDRTRVSDYHRFLARAGFPPDCQGHGGKPAHFSRTFAAGLAEPYTKAAFVASEAARFLRERRDGQPFFLSISTLEPHPPTFGPLNGLHDPAAIPVGSAFGVPVDSGASRHNRRRAERVRTEGYHNHPLGTEAEWRRLRANYYGLVTLVDRAFGTVLEALEASGQAENTVVVYTSDHGDMLGDHGLVQKGVFYEEAIRVPLLVRVPWLSSKRADVRAPISQVDLAPTFLELLELTPPGRVDGHSRAGWLRSGSPPAENEVVVEWTESRDHAEDGRSLITASGWKLNLYRDDVPELYDLNDDPTELNNLANGPAHRGRVLDLADRLKRWQLAQGDPLPLAV
jgi:arylsulfatase A-like enzyme